MISSPQSVPLEVDASTGDKESRRKKIVVEDNDIFENAPSDCSTIGDILENDEDANRKKRCSESGGSLISSSTVNSGSKGSQGSQSFSESKQTVNTNPEWCKSLKINFHGLIINKCCLRTRDAVENNEVIEV